MQVIDAKELAGRAEALAIIYADACERYAGSSIRSTLRPDNHRLCRAMMTSWAARDYAWRELLAAVNRLDDAGEALVGRNILQSATGNAHVAEVAAMRKALDGYRGAA